MKARNYLISSSNSIDKHIQSATLEPFAPKQRQSSFLKETQDNLSTLIATINPNRALNNSSSANSYKRQSYSSYPTEPNTKPTLISEISSRLTHLETKLNSYQAKADVLRSSYQNSMETPYVSNDRYIQTNAFTSDSPALKRNLNFSSGGRASKEEDPRLINIEVTPSSLASPRDNTLSNQALVKERERQHNQQLLDKLAYIKRDNAKAKEQMNALSIEMTKAFASVLQAVEAKIKKEHSAFFKDFKAKQKQMLKDKKQLASNLKAMTEDKKALTSEVSRSKKDIEAISSQLYKAKEDNIKYITEIKAKYEPQIKSLQVLNKDLHRQLANAKDELVQVEQTFQCKFTLMESQIKQSEGEATDAKAELAKAKQELASLIESNRKIAKDLESKGGLMFTTKSKVDMLAKQVKYKEGQISDLQSKSERISTMNVENELKFKRELSVKSKELRNSREKGDRLLKQKTQIEIDNKSLYMKNEELLKEKKQLDAQLKHTTELLKKNKAECEEHTNSLFLLNEELNGFKKEVTKLRVAIDYTDKKEKEFDEYKRTMSKANERNEKEIQFLRQTLEVIHQKHIIDISGENSKEKISSPMIPPLNFKEMHKTESPSSLSEQGCADKVKDDHEESEKDNEQEHKDNSEENSHLDDESEGEEEDNQIDLVKKLRIEIEDLIKENETLLSKHSQEKEQMTLSHQKEKDELLKQNLKLNSLLLQLKTELDKYQSDYSLLEIQLTQTQNQLGELEASSAVQIEALAKELRTVKEEYSKYRRIMREKQSTDALSDKTPKKDLKSHNQSDPL